MLNETYIEGFTEDTRIFSIAVPAAVLIRIARAAVTARRVEAAPPHARIVSPTLVHVHFA